MHLELIFIPLNLKRKQLLQQYQQKIREKTHTQKTASVLFHQKSTLTPPKTTPPVQRAISAHNWTTSQPYQNLLWSPYNLGTSNHLARQPNAFQAQYHHLATLAPRRK